MFCRSFLCLHKYNVLFYSDHIRNTKDARRVSRILNTAFVIIIELLKKKIKLKSFIWRNLWKKYILQYSYSNAYRKGHKPRTQKKKKHDWRDRKQIWDSDRVNTFFKKLFVLTSHLSYRQFVCISGGTNVEASMLLFTVAIRYPG